MPEPATKKTAHIKDRLRPDTTIKYHYGGEQPRQPRFVVGYWSIRGLGAPIRMMLSAAQINHWVVMYDVVEKKDSAVTDGIWEKSTWLRDKEWLVKDFPFVNLPFLVDCEDGTVLSQTNAILSYLGRELGMLGKPPREASRCDELLCEIMDLRNLMVRFAYDPNTETAQRDAERLVARARIHFTKLERWLEMEYPNAADRVFTADTAWPKSASFCEQSVCHLVGGTFTAPDFHLWEMLDQFHELDKKYQIDVLGTATTYSEEVDALLGEIEERQSIFPYLKEFHTHFIKLPANEQYAGNHKLTNSSVVPFLPLNNVYARFGSDPATHGKYSRGQETPWRNLGTVDRWYS